MKKLFLVLLFLTSATFLANAQTGDPKKDVVKKPVVPAKPKFLSIGADIGLPVGDANSVYNLAVGGSIKLELPLNKSPLNFTFTTGYNTFITKSAYSSTINNPGFIPAELGLKYFASPNIYFEGDVGISYVVTPNYGGAFATIVYDPIVGVIIPMANKNAFDIGLKYEGRAENHGTLSQVALRLAYRYKL